MKNNSRKRSGSVGAGQTKHYSKGTLLRAMIEGQAAGYKRQIGPLVINAADPAQRYPVQKVRRVRAPQRSGDMAPVVRCTVDLRTRGAAGTATIVFDVSQDFFDRLPPG